MSVTLPQWTQVLQQTTDFSTPHSWICEVQENGGERKVVVLSQEQQDKFFESHSRWDSLCRKLSFSELVTVSQNLVDSMKETQTYRLAGQTFKFTHDARQSARNAISHHIHCENVFSDEFIKGFLEKMKGIEREESPLREMQDALEKMSQRSIDKHTVEKTSGLWGTIKWYVWSLFYDQSDKVKQIATHLPSSKECKEAAKEALKERILLNMDSFKECTKKPFSPDNDHTDYMSDETVALFSSPAKVKQLWMTKFAEDKLPNVSAEAQDVRKRIIGMVKIRDELNKDRIS